MISDYYKESTHIDTLPFSIVGADINSVMYVRHEGKQYWKNPKGGWDVTNYQEVLDSIDRLHRRLG